MSLQKINFDETKQSQLPFQLAYILQSILYRFYQSYAICIDCMLILVDFMIKWTSQITLHASLDRPKWLIGVADRPGYAQKIENAPPYGLNYSRRVCEDCRKTQEFDIFDLRFIRL